MEKVSSEGMEIRESRTLSHRRLQSTQSYIHLSGRDLVEKLARGMKEIHARRVMGMSEALA